MRVTRVELVKRFGDYRVARLVFDDTGREIEKDFYFGGLAERLCAGNAQRLQHEFAYKICRAVLEARRDAALESGREPKSVRASDEDQRTIMKQMFRDFQTELDQIRGQ